MSDLDSFAGIADARAFAQAIVDTIVDPLIVLDDQLRVITASRSFYVTFGVDRRQPKGVVCMTWAMANGTFRSFVSFLRDAAGEGFSRRLRSGA
jgi:PAS domain-containing protein